MAAWFSGKWQCQKKKQMTDFESLESDYSIAWGKIKENPILKSFLAGSISGTCSTVIFQPLDLVKTRLQTPVPALNAISSVRSLGIVPIIASVVQQEQLSGLWKGITPSLARCIPGVGLYFSSLHILKTNWLDRTNKTSLGPIEAVMLGMTARTISGVCMIPFTVLKTRVESGVYRYGSMSDALRTIYRMEGARGLCCGLVPTLFRDAPFSGLYLMFYTQTKQALPQAWLDGNASSPIHFTCGIFAGVLASFVTQPADVIKTKMQLYPDKFKNLTSVVVYVHHKYGPTGYFKGLVPRMLRRTLMAAMAWTIYERITRGIGLK